MTQPTTDRELLEMAAKGAGIDVAYQVKFGFHGRKNPPMCFYRTNNGVMEWNPSMDDHDLLELLLFVTRYDNFNLFDNEVLEEALQDIRTALAMHWQWEALTTCAIRPCAPPQKSGGRRHDYLRKIQPPRRLPQRPSS